jgi:hypothetical protein
MCWATFWAIFSAEAPVRPDREQCRNKFNVEQKKQKGRKVESLSVLLSTSSGLIAVCKGARTRVARWFIFKPKVPIWVNFGGP